MDSSSAVQQLNPTGADLGHSPVTVKPSSVDRSRGYEEGEPDADLKRRNKRAKLDDEMEWNFLHVTDWMSACLPGTNSDSVFQPFNVTLNKNEAAMYPGLCNGINDVLEQIDCTEFLTYCTADLPDNSVAESDTLDIMDTSPLKVDLSILPKRHAKPRTMERKANNPSIQPAASGQHSSSSSPIPSGAPLDYSNSPHAATHPSGATTVAPDENVSPLNAQEAVSHDSPSERGLPRAECSWHWAEVLLEVKLRSKYFPFPEHNPLSGGAEHVQSRGQLALYASQVLRMQHRKHVFLVSICGKYARFVRFDRSGAIVSESFDYTTEAGATFIGQFLYRLFRPSATPEERGADPTATPASDGDAEFFYSLHEQPPMGSKSRIGKHFKDAADRTWPIYTLNIASPWSRLGDDQNPLPVRRDSPLETHRCLVGKPMFTGRSLMGRGTKCFVGWDLDAGRPVMIKDSWRADVEGIWSELDTYTTLWEGKTTIKATYIPTPLGGGDVYRAEGDARRYQRTLVVAVPVLPHTPKPERIPRIHTRLVLKEICESLEDFTDAEQLVGVIFTALMAHSQAWKTHKILHRDISVHNILIYYPNPNDKCGAIGLLSDWDLARTERQLQQGPVLIWRSGTWQYMSALLQFMREKHYEVSDDLESFMHVLNWCALRFLPNKWSDDPAELATHMHGLFNRHVSQKLEDGTIVSTGVLRKLMTIREGEPFASVEPTDHPFAELLKDLAVLCQQHYATYDIHQIMANSKRLEDRDQSAKPKHAEPEPSSTFYHTTVMTSDMSLEWLLDPEELESASESASPSEPTTPTRAGSSRPSGPGVDETLQSNNVVILNSPPPTPRTMAIKDRSESPLLDHKRFMKAILKILKRKVRWDLLPKRINALEPQNVTGIVNGGSSGSSTGSKRRSAGGNDEHYAGAKRKKSNQPSSRGSPADGDDPFLDNSSAAAAPGTPGRGDEGQVGNVATQLFRRANSSQVELTRTGARGSSRARSSRTTPASSRSASPTA